MNAPHKPGQPGLSELDLSAFPEPNDISSRPAFFGTGRLYPPPEMAEEERAASWQRFLDLTNAGYRSDGTKMTRDEMNER